MAFSTNCDLCNYNKRAAEVARAENAKLRELMKAVVDNSYLNNDNFRIAKHAQFDAMAKYLEEGE